MKEEFLHFIWKNNLYDNLTLVSDGSLPLKVINPGDYNRDSGPDFFNSRIVIGDTEWAGNVEIHLKSSQWVQHSHNLDHSYDNVILHVVHEDDSEVYTASGHQVENAIMRWNDSIYSRYEQFLRAPGAIACSSDLHTIEPFAIRQWITRLSAGRLKSKADRILPMLRGLNNDWEETLYRLIARYFGMNINAEPFYMLAARVPLRLIRKHSDNLLQVEALLFGQAGMLEEGLFREAVNDHYYMLLVREYKVLQRKYSLKPLDGWIWKFSRMRPANFPTIRISQLAMLLSANNHLFSALKEAGSAEELFSFFRTTASGYWNSHYIFGKESRVSGRESGRTTGSLMIINCVIPMIFLYGLENCRQEYCDRALDLSDNIPPETNRITREWESAGVVPLSAFESQGLIELRERMCKIRDCLNCHIGTKLISLRKESNPRSKHILEDPES